MRCDNCVSLSVAHDREVVRLTHLLQVAISLIPVDKLIKSSDDLRPFVDMWDQADHISKEEGKMWKQRCLRYLEVLDRIANKPTVDNMARRLGGQKEKPEPELTLEEVRALASKVTNLPFPHFKPFESRYQRGKSKSL